MTVNEISYKVVGICLELHKALGPGLLESVYEQALAYDLREAGFLLNTQVALPVVYKEIRMEAGYRADIIVENKLLLELKSVEALAPVHFSQTLTYIKLGNFKLGLLINFNSAKLKDSIHRVVNNLSHIFFAPIALLCAFA
jgi:GxxExxY protein